MSNHRPDVFRALGNESRLRIMHVLLRSPIAQCSTYLIGKVTFIDRGRVREHLLKLESAGLAKRTVTIDHGVTLNYWEANFENPAVPYLQIFFKNLEHSHVLPLLIIDAADPAR